MTPLFSSLVVPTDFSRHAGHALRYAETLAGDPAVTLRLVHAVDLPTSPTLWSAQMYVPDLSARETAAVKDAEQRLERLRKALAARGVAATTAVVLGPPAEAVTAYASEAGADLIVMSTHGRTGLAHLAMGSVAEHVVRMAPCPVLTIRPQAKTSGVRAA